MEIELNDELFQSLCSQFDEMHIIFVIQWEYFFPYFVYKNK